MATYLIVLEYDGTRYRGWQEQRDQPTVAGALRRAAEQAAGEPVELGGSGRTDAGVHALGQAAHLRLARQRDPEALRRELNERLPPDIHVLRVEPAPLRFHARHSAAARSYLYQISRRRTAFAKRFVWWVKDALDVEAMAAAAAHLPGKRDLAPFCEQPEKQDSTLVVVERAEVGEAGSLVLVRLVASHFLWKMVRRLVGTLARVGSGELEVAAFRDLVAGGVLPPQGAPAAWTAPPSGLFLERVVYPGDPPLGGLEPAVPVS